jgi:hypothetical protein
MSKQGLVQRAAARCAAALSTHASSSCALSLSASDAALGNEARSNGARRRTTHNPPRKASAWAETAARIWRLSSVRVTDRRACRLGTTAPSHRPVKALGTDSSTGSTMFGAPPVDNSVWPGSNDPADFGLCGELGRSAKWWIAKCALLAKVRVRKTRSKSADRSKRPITARPPIRSDRAGRAVVCAQASDGQTLAALGAARVDHGTPAARLHANQEPVRAGAANFGGLVGAFHDLSNSVGWVLLD